MCARAPLGRGEPETADDLLDRRPGERAARKAAPDFRTEQDVEFESPDRIQAAEGTGLLSGDSAATAKVSA